MSILAALTERVQNHAVDLVRRAADVAVEDTKANASRSGLKNPTGALVDGISHTEPQATDTYVSCQIMSTAEHSRYQDEGTGIYGPTGQRIFPTTAKALRFYWPAAGGVVFAKSVAGAPGRHFFHEPMPERWHDSLAQSAGPP